MAKLTLRAPRDLMRFVATKGSVALDGVSLTVNEVTADTFSVLIIPHTLSGDGDPLDVLAMMSEPSFTGCMIEVRPLGVLDMVDSSERDQKVLAVMHETTAETKAQVEDMHAAAAQQKVTIDGIEVYRLSDPAANTEVSIVPSMGNIAYFQLR